MRGDRLHGRRGARTVAALLTCVVAAVPVLGGCGAESAIPPGAAVAAVADPKGVVVLVDLERGAVLRTVRMRSAIGDIAADPLTGSFVTAQSGGVGSEADDVLGVIPMRGGAVRYVRLPRPNPTGVESCGNGTVLVDHGWVDARGVFTCLVDLRSGRVVREGRTPDNNRPIRVLEKVGWSSGVRLADDVPTLHHIDLRSLEVSRVAEGAYASIECTVPGGLAGWILPQDGAPQLARFDPSTGAVVSSTTVELDDGPGSLACAGGVLVAVDGAGADLESPGRRLLLFDAKTLEARGAVRVAGAPSDVARWGERVIAVDWVDRRLLVLDPKTATVERSIELPEMAALPLRLAVIDR